jgi:hypothetical protein
MSKLTVAEILRFLNVNQIRATYRAVAGCIGGIPQGVSQKLGARRPEASWVVSAKNGYPTGYATHQMHPNLFRSRQVITSGQELLQRFNDWRISTSAQTAPS